MNANNKPKPMVNQAFKVSQSPLFPLGRLVATPGALALLDQHGIQPITLLHRHVHGDWGDVDKHDRQANEAALHDGSRLFSVYYLSSDAKVWAITEATAADGVSRFSTCLLLPQDY